jgi:hypothetical protein
MKTTIEIPDELFREAKAEAARRGVSLSVLVAEALRDKVRPWMGAFGGLKHLRKETARVNKIIEAEFGQIDH